MVKKTNKALIVFARKPELGKVKTRLAVAIGNEKALDIYIRLLKHTKQVISNITCDKYVFLTETQDDDFWKDFLIQKQSSGDLGERMENAFLSLFEKGYEQVMIIGSDCPALNESHIQLAFEALQKTDIVIGPAEDGGYYLLAMNRLQAFLFKNKAWSTNFLREQTIDEIIQQKLNYFLLPTLSDVDELTDLPMNWL